MYSAPAGQQPAGANRLHPEDAILPDGRTAAPVGSTVFVGMNPLGVAVSPDGRFAILSNDAEPSNLAPPASAPFLTGGSSLAVVDTRSMRVVNVYRGRETFYAGIVAMRDPAQAGRTIVLASDVASNSVAVFDLAADGTLTREENAIDLRSRFPATISLASDGRTAYVANNIGGTVSAIDVAARRVTATTPVGFFPFGVAADGNRVFVTNTGLSEYTRLAQPARAPQFAVPSSNDARSSSLSVVSTDGGAAQTLRLDLVPDGVTNVGGIYPGAIVVRRDARYGYVSMGNVDRVATLSLAGEPRVIAGLDLRLFVDAPYGTQPSAEALSANGDRLYVALSGLNAVAVLDARNPAQLHRLGLIPTGWYPSALAISPDGRYLYVANAKGVDGWGTLQRVDLRTVPLVKATLSALRYSRVARAARPNPIVPALRSGRRSASIDRVVYISVGNATFDGVFGDLARANASAGYSLYPESVTPNLHALARTFALADNFYAVDPNVDANRLAALTGEVPARAQRTLGVRSFRAPFDAHGQDPEDYPRSGYLFNALARAQLPFRDYGGLTWLSGYQELQRPGRNGVGLGGVYTLDVPGLAALNGRVALDYPGSTQAAGNAQRVAAFVADQARDEGSGEKNAFTYLWLPASPGADGAADADRALGAVVDALSHDRRWGSTAIFIVPDGVQEGRDHVNAARSYALVVSPFAKRAYVGHEHLSVPSVLKTEEELLGLGALSLNDLLATDMADFFSTVPYPTPYQATR